MLKKILCFVLAVSMLLSLSACGGSDSDTVSEPEESTAAPVVYTEKAGTVKKSETVYVNIDGSGKVLQTNITDWLHTDKAQVFVNDVSNLGNITNIKSDIEPIVNGSSLTWNMDTTDLYYGGTSDKELPVSIGMKYYLDGKEIKSYELAEKSGKVRVDVTMTNNCSRTIADPVSGEDVEIFLPVLVAGVAILPEAEFSEVSVVNGKTIGDGTKKIAIMLGMPGLADSLALGDDALGELSSFDLSGNCSLEMTTKDFSLGNMYFAVLPLCSLDLGLVVPDSMEDLSDNLQKLKKMLDSIDAMNVEDVFGMILNDGDKITELTGMVEDAVNLYSSNKALIEVLEKYFTGENLQAIANLVSDMDSSSVKEAVELLSNPVLQTFFNDLPALADDLDALMPVLESLNKDMEDPAVKAAFDNLPATIEQLTSLKQQLEDNRELIDALGVLVSSENLDTISQLANELNGFDFNGIISQFNSLFGDSDSILDRAKEWLSFGMDYRIYSDAAEDMQTSVIFVYQTPSISA